MDYDTLNKIRPEGFLVPDNFRTEYDNIPDNIDSRYGELQYQKGLDTSNASHTVGITASGTWFAEGKSGSLTTSSEGIGFHSCTADLLRGLLVGSARFVVYRHGKASVTIKEARKVPVTT